jgi:tripartite-type tricarboxylate transporter receptor subunit TctC
MRLDCFFFAAAFVASLSLAQEKRPEYPARPVRLIVPSSIGSPPDLVGRMIGEKLAAALGQTIVADNRAGATGIIGLDMAAKAAGDGYTLAVFGMPFVVITHLVSKMPYDTERDLTAVAQVALHYHLLAMRADSPVSSVAALVDAARAKPNAFRFSSGGNGTPAHLSSALFIKEAKLRLQHIPYRAAPAAAQALLSGEVDLMIGSVAMLSPHVKAGRLRPLATPAPKRIPAHPAVPTFAEAGYPGVRVHDWIGIVAPAGTPRSVIARLNSEIESAAGKPDIRHRLESIGMESAHAGPEVFGQHIRAELKRWKALVREAGITAD